MKRQLQSLSGTRSKPKYNKFTECQICVGWIMTPYVWVAVSLQAAPQKQPPHLPFSHPPKRHPHGFIKYALAGEVLQLLFSTLKMDRDPLDKYDAWLFFKSELTQVFLSSCPPRWNGHFQSKASSLLYHLIKWRHLGPNGWLAFHERQPFLSLRGMKQSLKLHLELADGTGGKPLLLCMRGSVLDVVIFPAVNKANKFWSGPCAPEKGADCTVPTVWSLLATARQIKQGRGKGWGAGGTAGFMPLNWVIYAAKNRDKEWGLSLSLNYLC